jgi:hypothetical protein
MRRSLPVLTYEQTSLDQADWSVSCQEETAANGIFIQQPRRRRSTASSAQRKPSCSSGTQLIEQRLGLLEHRRIEAFGKPVVDGREQIASLGSIALVAPEAGETGGGP